MATIPATTKKRGVPVIGFIAHVDTSPEMSGAGVKPIVHRNYRGQDLVLPDDPSAVIRLSENPALAGADRQRHHHRLGHDAARRRQQGGRRGDRGGGRVPDGSTRRSRTARSASASRPTRRWGSGHEVLRRRRSSAPTAPTPMDGETLGRARDGDLLAPTRMTVTFQGFNTHPGFAKGKMVNSIKVAADFIDRLPKDGSRPRPPSGSRGLRAPLRDRGRGETAPRSSS